MAATVQIVGYYAGVKTPLTVQRYNTSDQRDPGLSYPNNVPPAGETYRSYWVYSGAEIVSGDFSQLTYWRCGGPGNIVSQWNLGAKGAMVQVALKDEGEHGILVEDIVAANGELGLSGYDIKDAVNGIPYYNGEEVACANFDDYTTSAPLVFDNGVYTETGVTRLFTHQLVLKDDTEFGEKTPLNYFVRWREI